MASQPEFAAGAARTAPRPAGVLSSAAEEDTHAALLLACATGPAGASQFAFDTGFGAFVGASHPAVDDGTGTAAGASHPLEAPAEAGASQPLLPAAAGAGAGPASQPVEGAGDGAGVAQPGASAGAA
jgi:hypothetical protein